MSRAASVHEADDVADKLAAALGETDTVAGVLSAATPGYSISLKDAKRAARELDALIGHAEKHLAQLQALLEMSKKAAARLATDVALVDRRERDKRRT